MRSIQWSAEHYASLHGANQYPTAINDDFKTYFRGGVEGQRPAPVGLVNPYSGANEFPVAGTLGDPIKVRHSVRFNIPPGQIWYCPLGNGKGYAIVGGAADGKALMDLYNNSDVLVLTNISEQ